MDSIGIYVTTYGKNVKCGIGKFVGFKQRAAENPLYIISASPGAAYADNDAFLVGEVNPQDFVAEDWDSAISMLSINKIKTIILEHTFGIFKTPELFKVLDYYLGRDDVEFVVRMHTLYSHWYRPPEGTSSGLRIEEYNFLNDLLAYDNVKALAAFSDCTCEAARKAFPKYAYKITEIRHGAHHYPRQADPYSQSLTIPYARKKLVQLVMGNTKFAEGIKAKDKVKIRKILESNQPIIGQAGFINPERVLLYELRNQLGGDIGAIHIGVPHPDAVKEKYQPVLDAVENMRDYGSQENNIFLEVYPNDEIFLLAVAAPDIFLSFNPKITQSGRSLMRTALSDSDMNLTAFLDTSFPAILAGDFEGDGETLKMMGIPIAKGVEDLAKLTERFLCMERTEKAEIYQNIRAYRNLFGWREQASKIYELVKWQRPSAPSLDVDSSRRFVKHLDELIAEMRQRNIRLAV